MNGSPCKHQYVLWVNKLSDLLNFLPRFNPEQKKKFSEGIHRIVNNNQVTNMEPTEFSVDFNALQGTYKETAIKTK